ncbi:hypothetical protein [Candidatus Venteria ishoeyi]|uniref:hypothetical protein n=1 Tax=Candidatus Venteria ishoeyi TaxID=1899563 RepID=UPI0011B0B331|nr:hypothetical protein [Candidatus Venteria ishoeyi]
MLALPSYNVDAIKNIWPQIAEISDIRFRMTIANGKISSSKIEGTIALSQIDPMLQNITFLYKSNVDYRNISVSLDIDQKIQLISQNFFEHFKV